MRMIGEVLKITPIGVHHVDFIVPIPIRREGNPCLYVNDTISGVRLNITALAKIKWARLYLRCICLSSSVLKSISYPLGMIQISWYWQHLSN